MIFSNRLWSAAAFVSILVGGLTLVARTQPDAPVNFASAQAGATVTGPQNASGSVGKPMAVNDEEVVDYGPNHGYAWAYFDRPLLVTLAEEQTINKIELLLLDVDPRTYNYRIETSTDGQTFRTVADCTQGTHRGWQTHVFDPAPCRYIRVTFTAATVSTGSYHVVELAAYHQADPSQPSPLRLKYNERAKVLAQQRRRRPALIDLDELVDAVFDNEEVRRQAKELPPDGAIRRDTDEDGDPDLIVWRDRDTILAALDEDDDLTADGVADQDSDCWAADYRGDGEIDRAIDYADDDGDGDPDGSVLYLLTPNVWSRQDMTCVVIGDLDDDNELWFLDHYQYDQGTCQWKCDFIGNEFFSMGYYDEREKRWISRFENPFCFWDLDGDGDSEVVARFSGTDLTLRSLRYSFDVDNDATPEQPKDYDFSITALGRVELGDQFRAEYPLRGGGVLRSLDWAKGREAAEGARWQRAELCWDENDHNVNPHGGERVHERWEGVIAHGSEHFPQEGGPSCGPFNKRYEVDNDFSGQLRLYFSGVDRRIHLRGAEFGWLDADYDYDGRVDLRFRYEDTDDNGFFDTWQTDGDGDGQFEQAVTVDDEQVWLVSFDYDAMRGFYLKTVLAEALAANQARLAALKEQLGDDASRVERYWNGPMKETFYAAEKVQSSLEGQRYYTDLMIAELAARAEPGPVSTAPRPDPLSRTIELTNPLDLARPAEAVILDPTQDPQLHRWLTAARPFLEVWDGDQLLPAQADDLDGNGMCEELVILVDLKPRETKRLRLTVPVAKPPRFAKKTQANRDLGASIGWESNRVAYRSYYGKVDFFGKKIDGLILHRPLGDYHHELDWGMDALHIGRASGVGGLHLWVNGQRIPAMNEEGEPENVKVTRRVVADGPVRTVVEVKLSGLRTPRGTFDLTRRFAICAEQQHTEERLTITGGDGEILYGPGLVRFADEQFGRDAKAGFLWSWFTQTHADAVEAGEVGLALLFPPEQFVDFVDTDLDHLVQLRGETGQEQRLALVADWAKGGRFRSADEWRTFVETLARRWRRPVEWRVEPGL